MLRRITVVSVLYYAGMFVAVKIWRLISISQAKCSRVERTATSAKWRRKSAHKNILLYSFLVCSCICTNRDNLCAMQEKKNLFFFKNEDRFKFKRSPKGIHNLFNLSLAVVDMPTIQ